jgi:glycosyltransferase involved in cell wall biosynthesis
VRRKSLKNRISWIVLNQSQSLAFQEMLGHLARRLGPCLLMTGNPFVSRITEMKVVKGPSYDRSGFASRVFSWGKFLAFAAGRTIHINRRFFLLVTTNPPLLTHLALVLNLLKGCPFGMLVWDIYPEHVVRSGLAGERNPLIRAWQALNRAALARASLIVTLSDQMADAISAPIPAIRPRIAVVPNFANTAKIEPIPKAGNPFAGEHGLIGKTLVLYSGNMGATHGLDGLLAAANRLRDRGEIVFLFIGDGLGKKSLVDRAKRLCLKNVVFLPMQPVERLRHTLTVGDIAVVAQAPGTEHLSLPSKTYPLMAAGCAILAITDQRSDLATLVVENNIGAVVDHDPERIYSSLSRLVDDPETLGQMKRRSREIAVSNFDACVVERRWEELLRPLVPQVPEANR